MRCMCGGVEITRRIMEFMHMFLRQVETLCAYHTHTHGSIVEWVTLQNDDDV